MNELDDFTVSEDVVKKKLKSLSITKSPGPDEIHPRLLRESADVLAKPLSMIYNSSIRSERLPEQWKDAHISAIFKKGDRKQPNNYRPISLTSIVRKVLESIIRDKIINHMEANNLFSNKQYGFITGRSTTLQLLKVLDDWAEIMDNNGQVDIIYMDFMKAFDQVPYKRLLQKVKSYGINGHILGWITNFLTNRRQRVSVNGCFSTWGSVTSGIPQGSVLGPLLFIIYINDLPNYTKSPAYLFADDTKLYRKIANKQDETILQKDLDALQTWSDKWLLNFHPDKCKVLTVGKRTLQTSYKLKSRGTIHELDLVHDMKDLGVTVDENLSFETHIQDKVNKANRTTGMIRRAFISLDEEMFLCLFKAFVRPNPRICERGLEPI